MKKTIRHVFKSEAKVLPFFFLVCGLLLFQFLFVSLGRMGNSRSALKMIMEELNDVDKAIEFAKEQDDAELWEDLILYSIDKPRKQSSLGSVCNLLCAHF